ncbi:hypothetical protein [Pseudomonas xanthosomatis]|uniref:hypothetical protein n=1 Tax=Pseudomonas xanthosomatis TaxID=2842356 RepID=UPI0035171804
MIRAIYPAYFLIGCLLAMMAVDMFREHSAIQQATISCLRKTPEAIEKCLDQAGQRADVLAKVSGALIGG